MTKFLIDTNSLIDAKDFFYAFDICPGFWRAISRHHESGELFSIDRVRDELMDGNDRLVDWAKDMPDSFFMMSTTPDAVSQYSQIIQWVQSSFTRQTQCRFQSSFSCTMGATKIVPLSGQQSYPSSVGSVAQLTVQPLHVRRVLFIGWPTTCGRAGLEVKRLFKLWHALNKAMERKCE